MARFFLGALPSPDDPKDADFAFGDSELMAGAAPSPAGDPSVLDAHVYRTQRFQDCLGHTQVIPVQVHLAVLGINAPPLSVMNPYSGSRLLASPPAPGEPLPDTGCSYRYALKWGRDVGMVPEDLWPETDENVGLTPPQDVRDAGRSARITTARRIIAPTVDALRLQLRKALELAVAGVSTAPGFVMPVHEAYFAIGKSTYERPEGKLVGYHGQAILGLDGDDALIPGSWGPEFGDNGLARISLPCLFAIGSEFWVQEIDLSTFKVAV